MTPKQNISHQEESAFHVSFVSRAMPHGRERESSSAMHDTYPTLSMWEVSAKKVLLCGRI